MIAQLIRTTPLAAVLAAAAFSLPAQAGGVSWSLGISAPIAPGVSIDTVVGRGGHARFGVGIAAPVVYAPPPAYYEPPQAYYEPAPVYYEPPPVYVAPPVYGVYGPPPVVYRSRPTRVVYGPYVKPAPYGHYHRPDYRRPEPVTYRPTAGGHRPVPVVGRPDHRGPYGPVAMGR